MVVVFWNVEKAFTCATSWLKNAFFFASWKSEKYWNSFDFWEKSSLFQYISLQ